MRSNIKAWEAKTNRHRKAHRGIKKTTNGDPLSQLGASVYGLRCAGHEASQIEQPIHRKGHVPGDFTGPVAIVLEALHMQTKRFRRREDSQPLYRIDFKFAFVTLVLIVIGEDIAGAEGMQTGLE